MMMIKKNTQEHPIPKATSYQPNKPKERLKIRLTQTLHLIPQIITQLILRKNHFKSLTITLFLQMLIPIKGLMKTALQTQIIMQVGAKITATMSS